MEDHAPGDLRLAINADGLTQSHSAQRIEEHYNGIILSDAEQGGRQDADYTDGVDGR
jgi:hypothetical protein